jgi:butyryl-CoA dehydrogenase
VEGDALLGPPGKGAGYLREILDEIRVMTGALAVGCGRAALEDSLAYAKERVQFGKPISKFQAIKLHLADMAVELETARCFVLYAAWRSDQGMENTKEAAMAKLYASEAALSVCDKAARVLASYGYAMEYPIQRYLRDIRFTLIGGGTSEILKLIIAKEIGT